MEKGKDSEHYARAWAFSEQTAGMIGIRKSSINPMKTASLFPQSKHCAGMQDYFDVSTDYIFCCADKHRSYDDNIPLLQVRDGQEETRLREKAFQKAAAG